MVSWSNHVWNACGVSTFLFWRTNVNMQKGNCDVNLIMIYYFLNMWHTHYWRGFWFKLAKHGLLMDIFSYVLKSHAKAAVSFFNFDEWMTFSDWIPCWHVKRTHSFCMLEKCHIFVSGFAPSQNSVLAFLKA